MTIKWISEKRKLKDLKDYDKNPRKMGKEEFNKLVESLKSDGYHQRLLINTDGTIIGGHARKKALLKAGYKDSDEIDVLVPEKMLEGEDFDRINIRDNLPYGSFDFEMLANLFDPAQLIEWGMPADWLQLVEEDIEVTEEDNEAPEVQEEAITKLGDVWKLGEHRLMCGDSVSITDIDNLLNKNKIDMVYTDPPYGIDESTNRTTREGGLPKLGKHRDYDKIIGDSSTQTAIDAYNLCVSYNVPTMVWWGANYYCHVLPPTGNWCVWDKREEEKQRDMNSDCELAWVKSKFNSVRIFRHLWKGLIKASEHGQARVHPTQKPIELALWCFKEYGKESKTILDLFGGSGSTLIACEKSKRKCFMMELSPYYCDVIIARWEKLTKLKAELLI